MGLIFSSAFDYYWELGQVAACELHALCGTDTTLPGLKARNEDYTRADMKSHGNTFKHLMNVDIRPVISSFSSRLRECCTWKTRR